ncbi:MAG: hypothetical protein GXX94_05040 [Chloroflexi bacterium]|nr:hypothetical protein [Chloroflexota bacterium]
MSPRAVMSPAMGATRGKLLRRLQYLWIGEAANVIVQPGVVVVLQRTLGQPVGLAGWYGLGLTVWIVCQGAIYWRRKARALRRDSRLEPATLRLFSVFKALNWALLGGLPLVLCSRVAAGVAVFASPLDGLVAYAYGLLALGEQINYYYLQLAYDNRADLAWLWLHRRLKEPALARDLRLDERDHAR